MKSYEEGIDELAHKIIQESETVIINGKPYLAIKEYRVIRLCEELKVGRNVNEHNIRSK